MGDFGTSGVLSPTDLRCEGDLRDVEGRFSIGIGGLRDVGEPSPTDLRCEG